MRKVIVYLVGVVLLITMVSTIVSNGGDQNNETINYSNLDFETVKISEYKLDRYNELINVPQVSFLIRNLPLVLEKDNLNTKMSIVYIYNYIVNFKNYNDTAIVKDLDNVYMNCDYAESMVYELFGKIVELDEYKQGNGYLIISENNLKMDSIDITVKDILYNKEYDVYKIIIEEDEQYIKIIYRYVDGSYVLLECL